MDTERFQRPRVGQLAGQKQSISTGAWRPRPACSAAGKSQFGRYRVGVVRLRQGSAEGRGSAGRSGELTPRSFTAFYKRFKPELLRWFRIRTHNEHLAAELTARTFLKAFEQREQHRGSTEQEARAWVVSIAQRELLQFYRHGKVEHKKLKRLGLDIPRPTEDEAGRVEQLIDATTARSPLQQALGQLPPQQRQAFERRFIAEETVAEVAENMNISEIAVRTAVFRARRRLADDPNLRRIVLGDSQHG